MDPVTALAMGLQVFCSRKIGVAGRRAPGEPFEVVFQCGQHEGGRWLWYFGRPALNWMDGRSGKQQCRLALITPCSNSTTDSRAPPARLNNGGSPRIGSFAGRETLVALFKQPGGSQGEQSKATGFQDAGWRWKRRLPMRERMFDTRALPKPEDSGLVAIAGATPFWRYAAGGDLRLLVHPEGIPEC